MMTSIPRITYFPAYKPVEPVTISRVELHELLQAAYEATLERANNAPTETIKVDKRIIQWLSDVCSYHPEKQVAEWFEDINHITEKSE